MAGPAPLAAIAETHFAPAEKAALELVRETRKKVLLSEMLVKFLGAIPDCALVLNRERQVVAANDLFLSAFNLGSIEQFLGRRPGEVVRCIFSAEGPAGCGTGNHCSTCGAVMSVLQSAETGKQASFECRLSVDTGNWPAALDLQVIATPIDIDGEPLTFCIFKDISDEKRRLVLERVFFHDVINTAGGIHGIASLLAEHAELEAERAAEYKQWMITLTETLIDEINHHRKLLEAERGDFRPVLGLVVIQDLVRDIHALYLNHDIAEGRNLVVGNVPPSQIISDSAILRRILGNMVKNALEATPRGGTVTIAGELADETVSFIVHNPTVMPLNVQLQLFQRSFSTKEEGRGIGTYSMKLFGERYLKGKVGFISQEPDGTTFTFTIPRLNAGD